MPAPIGFDRMVRQLDARQWLPAPAVAELQAAKLDRILAHAVRHCPYYTERLGEAWDRVARIRRVEDLAAFPTLEREDVRQRLDAMVDASRDPSTLERRSTGGTSGVPMPFFVDAAYNTHIRGVVARGYETIGRGPFTPTVLVAGSPIDSKAWTTAKARMLNGLRRTRVVPAFELSADGLGRLADLVDRVRPRFVIAYANALSLLASYCRATNRDLRIAAVVPVAELVTDAHRETFATAFGAETFELYGAREAIGLAVECPAHAGLHVQADTFVVEILRGDTPVAGGEVGEIVITDLENTAMPMIRYRIGDLGVLTGVPCPCGRGFPLLRVTHGRSLDVIVTPDGRLLPGEFFPHLFKEVDRDVERFQVRQEVADRVEVDMVVRSGVDHRLESYLGDRIGERLGPGVELVFNRVASLRPGESGKYRPTRSSVGLPWSRPARSGADPEAPTGTLRPGADDGSLHGVHER
ncbi:MAG: phenylacetate--CoA ligase family protein [Acidimicrobiales bacterium]